MIQKYGWSVVLHLRDVYNCTFLLLKFSILTSCRHMTISVCRIVEAAWVVLGWILDLPGGTERNHMLHFSEVQWSFLEPNIFSELCLPSSSIFKYYIMCGGKLSKLQAISKKLLLDCWQTAWYLCWRQLYCPFEDIRSTSVYKKKCVTHFLTKVPSTYCLVGRLVLFNTIGNGNFCRSWLPNPISIFTAVNKLVGMSY